MATCRKCQKALTTDEYKGAYEGTNRRIKKYWICSACGTRTDARGE